MSVLLPLDLNFMAKVELGRIPLFGIFFRTIDISVDRKNAIQSAKAYKRAIAQLKNNIRSIVVFPEGGIKHNEPTISNFKDGAFKMAVENGVEILPVTITDNWHLGPSDAFDGHPGQMRILVHSPIETKNLTDENVPELKKNIHEMMQGKLDEYWKK